MALNAYFALEEKCAFKVSLKTCMALNAYGTLNFAFKTCRKKHGPSMAHLHHSNISLKRRAFDKGLQDH